MKMKYSAIIVSSFLVISIVGCQSSSSNQNNENVEDTISHEDHATEEQSETSEVIQLNNGQKWSVNPEMKPFLLKGEELVKSFSGVTLTDYQTLASNLKAQDDNLIKSCTMKGESHEQLHKWLHPHLELVEQLSGAKDLDHSKDLLNQLKSSYSTFDQYFQ